MALAPQGPEAVFGWIYGAESHMARQMAGLTWADLQMKSPDEGARERVEGLRKARELMRE